MEINQDYYTDGKFIKRGRLTQTFLKNSLTRYVAYFCQSWLFFSLIFFKKMFRKNTKNYKYNICVCGIFKNEERFLEEWIQYHLEIGIEHFYLYNNNSSDGYYEVLKPFIDKGVVDLIDWPKDHAQMEAFEDCYLRHKEDTHWLTFIDIDEFICPVAKDNITSWLSSYKDYPGVAVYWKQFGSNGRLNHDYNKLVIEQYTQCWPRYSVLTKMFCNMDFPIVGFSNPHILYSEIGGIKLPPINQYKKFISIAIHRTSLSGDAPIQINHYWGKAYDFFLEFKMRPDVFHKGSQIIQEKKNLLRPHEAMCTTRDYTIQRYLLQTKLKMTGQE